MRAIPVWQRGYLGVCTECGHAVFLNQASEHVEGVGLKHVECPRDLKVIPG